MSGECVFCAIIEKNDPHHEIVWQDEAHLAFLSAQPVADAHVLVVPKTHASYVFDMAPDAYAALLETSRKLALPLRGHTGAKRIALAIEGFQVSHVHVHLVPANEGRDVCAEARTASADALARVGDGLRTLYADIV